MQSQAALGDATNTLRCSPSKQAMSLTASSVAKLANQKMGAPQTSMCIEPEQHESPTRLSAKPHKGAKHKSPTKRAHDQSSQPEQRMRAKRRPEEKENCSDEQLSQ